MTVTPESVNQTKEDADFHYLQLLFSYLDLLLHQQITRQSTATGSEDSEGMEATQNNAFYFISEADAYELLQHPFSTSSSPLPPQIVANYAQPITALKEQIDLLAQTSTELRFVKLARLLALSPFDLNVLIACLAPELDLRYAKLYAFLHNDLTQKRPSVNLLLDLLAPEGQARLSHFTRFNEDAPLQKHRLISLAPLPGITQPILLRHTIELDPGVSAWLLSGEYKAPVKLKKAYHYETQPEPMLPFLMAEMQTAVAQAANTDALLIFTGLDQLSQDTAAQHLAATTKRPLLTLKLNEVVEANIIISDAIQLLLRDALLTGAIPYVTDWDSCLKDSAPSPDILMALSAHPGLVIIAGEKAWQPRDIVHRRQLRWLDFPVPSYQQRQNLLHHFLVEVAPTIKLSKETIASFSIPILAGQFQLTTAKWRDMVYTAVDLAFQAGKQLDNSILYAAARSHSSPRLTALATKLTPRYSWSDLILPENDVIILQELVNTVNYRPKVLEEWGVGQKLTSSAGITVLFAGPPGTGKTMAAEVITAELGLDIFKINLSSMVSKYIGETEKNLEQLFTEAEQSNAILFFDEADAIFGKRSEVKDARDRYANIEVSYLLQRMERYDGVTILATNLSANLDDAFLRRIQFRVTFPFPEKEQRLHIWKALFPSSVPRSDDIDLQYLADRFEFAGGNIRNIIVSAAYLAASNGQVVKMEHLLHATKRELQKVGRMINPRDFEV